ncbi:hypothetical protein Pint_34674 [Pistacia integerrima]|uniref:Uncharacterized protein n=1 Tax=Pistacia integerrima TaxID=434235 RepID=A0ACC0X7J7_9ROSI|nr:hypothetical protein Pint_34674 [Pistacia integerrima]
MPTPSPSTGCSIFGSTPSASTGSGIFGSMPTPSASTGCSIFGSTPSASTGSSIFGMPTPSASTGCSIFGSTLSASTGSTIFGAVTPPTTSTRSSILGGTSSAIPSTGSSISGFSVGATSSASTNQAQVSNPFSVGSAQASVNATVLATSTQSTPNQFGSISSSTSFGLAVNPAFSSGIGMEDSMAEDTVQASTPAVSVFGQQPMTPSTGFVFQASGSLDFNAGGGFKLGSGSVDKSRRKIVKLKGRHRKK